MSLNARRFQSARRTCCCGHPAVYFSQARRKNRARADHPLCARCWRSEADAGRPARPRTRWGLSGLLGGLQLTA
ncbi:MAG: hypothetical protein FJ086_14745 [Deltaproteobacteria bacterium]|nr:hypothetical protein [Deltaproteobacteria bacterium]